MSSPVVLSLRGQPPPLHLLTALPTPEQSRALSLSLTVIVPVYNERHLVATSVGRLLGLTSELISRLEVIIVDDCSTDGSREVLERLAAQDARIRLIRHARNQGKGAAIRTARDHATGDVCVIHDADMEYNPEDLARLMLPFIREGADAVFGSRYISAEYRRALMYRHTQINNILTTFSNWLTDLDLTDVETCYKAVKTSLFKSIPLRSNDFRFEVELAMKLAKRRARIYEVPIRYSPRSYEEGKKIRARDGVLAVLAMLKYSIVDDIYREDEYGSNILNDLQSARRFNQWMGDTLRPYLGDRILEIGAGIGNLTNQFIPRELYVASDINPHYLEYMRSYAIGKPYLRVMRVDAGAADDFADIQGAFDTAIMINVLEHVPDEQLSLRNLRAALAPGGRVVILVPQHPRLFGSLDEVLEHRERYTSAGLRRSLETAGFEVERVFDFNRISVPAWFWNARILRRRNFARLQLKILEVIMPLVRGLDRVLPWPGISAIGIARKR
ncbi:MAG TPA: bifunctional glycosyltransferase/class I SAM-dependent methyltransferase [Thermoflexales bacterium]|nr:bifunctional glycosyltransferase/class I SAM-dependent methyltransferase [Thermoflexales bacterium]